MYASITVTSDPGYRGLKQSSKFIFLSSNSLSSSWIVSSEIHGEFCNEYSSLLSLDEFASSVLSHMGTFEDVP